MQAFRYLPIPQEHVENIRSTRQDEFGHVVEMTTATENGYGPCRACLRQIQPGEQRLLFSYAPVQSGNPYNEVGPVFIHAHNCTAYSESHVFPPEVRAGRLHIPLVVRAYSTEKRMIAAVPVPDNGTVEKTLEEIFRNPAVAFAHLRNAQFQCFIAQVERA